MSYPAMIDSMILSLKQQQDIQAKSFIDQQTDMLNRIYALQLLKRKIETDTPNEIITPKSKKQKRTKTNKKQMIADAARSRERNPDQGLEDLLYFGLRMPYKTSYKIGQRFVPKN